MVGCLFLKSPQFIFLFLCEVGKVNGFEKNKNSVSGHIRLLPPARHDSPRVSPVQALRQLKSAERRIRKSQRVVLRSFTEATHPQQRRFEGLPRRG